MIDRLLCIYHGNCADGFTAAWAVWKRFPDAEFIAGVYGQDPPGVAGRDVVLVDFSYPEPIMMSMARTVRSLLVLDHHKTAREALAFLPEARPTWEAHLQAAHNDHAMGADGAAAIFDMDRSGARLAWEFFHPNEVVPRLVRHVEDRDLWRFAIEGTREIQAAVFSYHYDFACWNLLAEICEDEAGWQAMRAQGEAIERKHRKDIAELLLVTRRSMRIGGIDVPVANLPYTMASDAAGRLAEQAPFAACYFDKPGARVFSLRSRGTEGVDVSEIAKRYGGGGHRNAAGFQAPPGWEGDA